MKSDRSPSAAESEKQTLGSILLLPEVLEDVKRVVRPFDFATPIHRASFKAMLDIDTAGEPIEIPLLIDRLKTCREFAGEDPAAYWLGVAQSVATAAHAEHYARQVRDAADKRGRIAGLESVIEAARNGHTAAQIDDLLFSMTDDWRREREAVRPSFKFSFEDLERQHPHLYPPIIDGIGREGEIVNLISTSKAGKSWLTAYVLLCQVTGRYIFGRFKTSMGRCLLVDNELHRPTIVSRVNAVAKAMGLSPEDWKPHLDVWALRGNLRSFDEICDELEQIERGTYKVIAYDAKYRFAKDGELENDNSHQTLFYNRADRTAERTGALQLFVGHSSKGSQSDKRVTDVGAGAGSQSRAADTHIILREHEQPNTVVLEAALRSFPPVEPLALRWQFPLWVAETTVDPSKLKGRLNRSDQRQIDQDRQGINAIVDALRKQGPATARQLRSRTGLSRERLDRLVNMMQAERQVTVTKIEIRGNECDEYSLSNDTED